MKKIYTLALAAIMGGMAANAEVTWLQENGNEHNLCYKASYVEVSSEHDQAAKGKEWLVDGNSAQPWQSLQCTDGVMEFCAVGLNTSEPYDLIEMNWRSGHPLAYDVYVTDNEPQFTQDNDTHKSLSAEWLEANKQFIVKHMEGRDNNDAYIDYIQPEDINVKWTGKYIVIAATTFNEYAKRADFDENGMGMGELRAGSFGRSIYDPTKLVISVPASTLEGNSVIAKLIVKDANDADVDFSKVSDVQFTCEPADGLTITASDQGADLFNITGVKQGTYTLTASVKFNDGTIEAVPVTFTVAENPDKPTSVEGINASNNAVVNVYTMTGALVRANVSAANAAQQLPAGLYIVGGKKLLVK